MTKIDEKRKQCNLTNSEETIDIVKEYCLPPKNSLPPEKVAPHSNIPVWWQCKAGHFFKKIAAGANARELWFKRMSQMPQSKQEKKITNYTEEEKASSGQLHQKIKRKNKGEVKMERNLFSEIFKNSKPIIGMIHLFFHERYKLNDSILEGMIAHALEDLEKLQPHVDGVIVENYGWGYQDSNCATEAAVVAMISVTQKVVAAAKIPVGVNILPNDYDKAFIVCRQTGAVFIQMDHVTGKFHGCESVDPERFMKIRSKYQNVAVLGGIHPKYYHLLDPTTSIIKSARTAIMLTDAIVVTGEHTGGETNIRDILAVKRVIGGHPVIVGSGLDANNAAMQISVADGAIVGSAFKKRGVIIGEPIDEEMVKELMIEVEKVRAEMKAKKCVAQDCPNCKIPMVYHEAGEEGAKNPFLKCEKCGASVTIGPK